MRPEPLPAWDEPSIFDEEDEAHLERLTQEAEADADAGRGVPHALVSEWLSRVGTADETPMPEEWYK